MDLNWIFCGLLFGILMSMDVDEIEKSPKSNNAVNSKDKRNSHEKLIYYDWMNDYNCRKKYIWNGKEFIEKK